MADTFGSSISRSPKALLLSLTGETMPNKFRLLMLPALVILWLLGWLLIYCPGKKVKPSIANRQQVK